MAAPVTVELQPESSTALLLPTLVPPHEAPTPKPTERDPSGVAPRASNTHDLHRVPRGAQRTR